MLLVILFIIFCAACVRGRIPLCEKSLLNEGLLTQDSINLVFTMKRNCRDCQAQAVVRLPVLKEQLYYEEKINIDILIGVNRRPATKTEVLPELKIDFEHTWNVLGKENGHIFIFDKCNRLTYQVVTPWSAFLKPYVWAAILATHYSNPCGTCENVTVKPKLDLENSTLNKNLTDKSKYLTPIETKMSDSSESLEDNSEENADEKERLKKHYSTLIKYLNQM